MPTFKKNQVFMLNCIGNPKGCTIRIDREEGNTVYYTYMESNQSGSANINGAWMDSAEFVGYFPMDEPFNFYICWVVGSTRPITKMYPTLDRAKEAAKYLIDKKGCLEVHIMKRELTAIIPSRVEFK